MDAQRQRLSERKAEPSRLLHRLSTADIKKMLPSDDPTLMLVDNRTLSNCIMYEHASAMKKLKIQVRLINYIKMAISKNYIKQELVGTKHQPADMMTKMLTSPTLQWLHMEEMMGSHPAVAEYKAIVKDMRRGRRAQGKLVHVEQQSDMAQKSDDHDGVPQQQHRRPRQEERMDDDGDGDGGCRDDGSEKMVGVVDRDVSDVEPSTIMANGSRGVRMAVDDISIGGDTAAAMEDAAQKEDLEALDPHDKQMRMKARLLEKRMEKLETERENEAAKNKINNGVESERTVQLRAELKAGKKRRLQQDEEEESENIKYQSRSSNDDEEILRERSRKSRKKRT